MALTDIWLNDEFASLWAGEDVFAKAFALAGQEYRALEQRQTLAFEHAGQRYFIKRHKGLVWKEILKNLLALRLPVASARNEFNAIRALQELGIAAPEPVAYGRRGMLPARITSFLITKDVGPHISLEDFCRPWCDTPPNFAEKLALLDTLAQTSRTMHAAGICHRDYYLCHFLRRKADKQLVLIDLHRALIKHPLAKRWIVKDIAGLYFSAMDTGLTRRDCFRFMARYSQKPLREILAGDWAFWQAVRKRALRIYTRDLRKRKPA